MTLDNCLIVFLSQTVALLALFSSFPQPKNRFHHLPRLVFLAPSQTAMLLGAFLNLTRTEETSLKRPRVWEESFQLSLCLASLPARVWLCPQGFMARLSDLCHEAECTYDLFNCTCFNTTAREGIPFSSMVSSGLHYLRKLSCGTVFHALSFSDLGLRCFGFAGC